MSLKARNNAGTTTDSLHGQLQKFLSFRHNAGTSTNSSRGQLEEACCQRLNRLSEVLSVGVACSLKGPPSEQIIKLLGTMYRLLKSATLLTKAPQSGSPPAFHASTRNWACHLACLPFRLLWDARHTIWHLYVSHWACHMAHLHLTCCEPGHSTWCIICSFADSVFACVCMSVMAD